MVIDISFQLPFSHCKFCRRLDPARNDLYANGELWESSFVCANAEICEAAQKAEKSEQMRKP